MAAKVILITGGNRGIGFGIVQAIAKRSDEHTIIIACRQKADAKKAITELQEQGFKSSFHALGMDVTSDESIQAAVIEIGQKYGRLDVLIHNAGIAIPEADATASRADWNRTFDTNITSVRIATVLFLPLLHASAHPRIINVSSARGSFTRLVSGKLPKVASVSYSTSKAALNFLTLLLAGENPGVACYVVSPGHCKTALNGFKGAKDPVDGGRAIAELAVAEEGKYAGGTFWEDEGEGMREVEW